MTEAAFRGRVTEGQAGGVEGDATDDIADVIGAGQRGLSLSTSL